MVDSQLIGVELYGMAQYKSEMQNFLSVDETLLDFGIFLYSSWKFFQVKKKKCLYDDESNTNLQREREKRQELDKCFKDIDEETVYE